MIDNLKKAPVKFSECYALDELVPGEVFNPVSHEAGLPANGTCQKRFSTVRLTIYEYILGSMSKK